LSLASESARAAYQAAKLASEQAKAKQAMQIAAAKEAEAAARLAEQQLAAANQAVALEHEERKAKIKAQEEAKRKVEEERVAELMRQAELAQKRAAAALPPIPAAPVGSVSSASDLLSVSSDTKKHKHDHHHSGSHGMRFETTTLNVTSYGHGLNGIGGFGSLHHLSDRERARIHLAPQDRISTNQCMLPMFSFQIAIFALAVFLTTAREANFPPNTHEFLTFSFKLFGLNSMMLAAISIFTPGAELIILCCVHRMNVLLVKTWYLVVLAVICIMAVLESKPERHERCLRLVQIGCALFVMDCFYLQRRSCALPDYGLHPSDFWQSSAMYLWGCAVFYMCHRIEGHVGGNDSSEDNRPATVRYSVEQLWFRYQDTDDQFRYSDEPSHSKSK